MKSTKLNLSGKKAVNDFFVLGGSFPSFRIINSFSKMDISSDPVENPLSRSREREPHELEKSKETGKANQNNEKDKENSSLSEKKPTESGEADVGTKKKSAGEKKLNSFFASLDYLNFGKRERKAYNPQGIFPF